MGTEKDKQKWIPLGNMLEAGLRSEFGEWLKKKLDSDFLICMDEIVENGDEISRGKAKYIKQLRMDMEAIIKNKDKLLEEEGNG